MRDRDNQLNNEILLVFIICKRLQYMNEKSTHTHHSYTREHTYIHKYFYIVNMYKYMKKKLKIKRK